MRSDDTVNWLTSEAAEPKAMKVTFTIPSGQTQAWVLRDLGAGNEVDLSDLHMGLRFHLGDYSNLSYLSIMLMDGAGGYSKWFLFNQMTGCEHAGWLDWTGTARSWTAEGSPADLSNIRKFYLQAQALDDTGASCVVTYDHLRFWPKLTTPIYCCTFDEIYLSQAEAAAYALSKGVPVTVFTTKLWVDSPARGLSLAQLKNMQRAGHLVANHTYAHLNWTTASADEMYHDLWRMSDWMCRNGFAAGSRVFASPVGGWPDDGDERFLGTLIDIHRSTKGISHTRSLTAPWDALTRYALWGYDDAADADLGVVANVGTPGGGYADGDHGVHVTLWHDLSAQMAGFKSHIDTVAAHVNAGRLKAVTMADLLQELA